MTERNEEIKNVADGIIEGSVDIASVVDQLSNGARRERQSAASALRQVARSDASLLNEYIDEIIDALNRPEAQTRWECLETLTLLVDVDARACGKAIPEADTALFDEDNGSVRLAAMRFLCKYGSTTPNRSEKVWNLIDEGIQCYHGDLEFNDMLIALIEFSSGKLDPEVKKQFSERMSFDAENAKGTLRRRAQQIVDNLAE